MSIPNIHGEKPTDPEPRPITPRRGSQTVIERPLRPSEAKATAVFGALDTSESRGLKTPPPVRPDDARVVGVPHSTPIATWIAIGAGAGASLLVVTFLIMWLIPRGETSPTAPSVSSNVPPLAAGPPSKSAAPDAAARTVDTGPGPAATPSQPVRIAGNTAAVVPEPGVQPDTINQQKQADASPSGARLGVTNRLATKDAPGQAPPAERLVAAAHCLRNRSLARP